MSTFQVIPHRESSWDGIMLRSGIKKILSPVDSLLSALKSDCGSVSSCSVTCVWTLEMVNSSDVELRLFLYSGPKSSCK